MKLSRRTGQMTQNMKTTKEELAQQINGREYGNELSDAQEATAIENGLVVVFGYSDDNVEFRGAIEDEIGAYEGTTVLIDREGVVPEREQIDDDALLERWFARKKTAAQIVAKWDCNGYSWMYSTEIPHACFDVMEGADKFCRGIVLEVESLP